MWFLTPLTLVNNALIQAMPNPVTENVKDMVSRVPSPSRLDEGRRTNAGFPAPTATPAGCRREA